MHIALIMFSSLRDSVQRKSGLVVWRMYCPIFTNVRGLFLSYYIFKKYLEVKMEMQMFNADSDQFRWKIL